MVRCISHLDMIESWGAQYVVRLLATCVEIPLYPCASGQVCVVSQKFPILFDLPFLIQKNFSSFINRFGLVMPTTTGIDSLTSAAAQTRANAAALAKPPFWYSFDYGMAHFVMMDTETDLGNVHRFLFYFKYYIDDGNDMGLGSQRTG